MGAANSLDGLKPSGFFALRSPLLAFEELRAWSDGVRAPAAIGDSRRIEDAVRSDRVMLSERLVSTWRRPEVREAVFLASPELDAALERSQPGESHDKALRSLAAYYVRMASRATPFGLFAGCSVGSFEASTHLEMRPRSDYGRHTRLDMDYLSALASALEADPAVRRTLRYQPNSSLYRAGRRLHYAEGRVGASGRSYHLVALDESVELCATLERASPGATLDELVAGLVDEHVSAADARDFVDELLASQVLMSNLGPPVTGDEAIHGLIDRLSTHSETTDVSELLGQVRDGLSDMDQAGVGGNSRERYAELRAMLHPMPARAEQARLFQVDMVKPAERLSLGTAVLDELERGVRILQRLANSDDTGSALRQFAEQFVARYEGAEVPLVEALDEEIGIGFETRHDAGNEPLLHGLDRPAEASEPAVWRAPDNVRLRLLAEALRHGDQAVELTPTDIDALAATDGVPLPDALSVMARLAAPCAEAVDRGDFRLLLQGTSGPSGARLLGRFCHADAELSRRVAEHLRAEEAQRPEAVFAEIVHLPEGRLGNILSRPVLREYEIPFLGQSAADGECQIPIADLRVTVRGARVVLRSARLNREVVPRLSAAHNFGLRSLGVYRFLCALQDQDGRAPLAWSWGPLARAPFLPRVTSGRLVFSRAAWSLSADELRPLVEASGAAQFEAVQALRTTRQLPRYVALVDSDNELLLDLDNVLSIESFVHLVKNRDVARVVELFPGPDELCVTAPEGSFLSELVIPFVRTSEPRPVALRTSTPTTVQRRFAPGSEWLFAKLYVGQAVADRVLVDVVAPLVDAALDHGAADNWFFIRYADPQPHVRLRLHGDPRRLAGEVLPLLADSFAPLIADGQLSHWQLDTYVREVERYGGADGILLAERLFGVDSTSVLAMLPTVPGDEGMVWRWRLALCGVDLLLDAFGLSIDDKGAWARRQRDAFASEFRVDGRVRRQLGEKHRAERQAVDDLVRLVHTADAEQYSALRALHERTRQLLPLVHELRILEESGRLSTSLPELAASYAHMHINRMLRSAHRYQELVLYELLDRTYRSQLARVHR